MANVVVRVTLDEAEVRSAIHEAAKKHLGDRPLGGAEIKVLNGHGEAEVSGAVVEFQATMKK